VEKDFSSWSLKKRELTGGFLDFGLTEAHAAIYEINCAKAEKLTKKTQHRLSKNEWILRTLSDGGPRSKNSC